jgi:hypothetical protein
MRVKARTSSGAEEDTGVHIAHCNLCMFGVIVYSHDIMDDIQKHSLSKHFYINYLLIAFLILEYSVIHAF